MRFYWLKVLLLSTFAFWATGAAKYTHEALEHHGRDASVVDDDDGDDDSASPPVVASSTPLVSHSQDQTPHPAKHACPVCQMLAAMMVVHSAPQTAPPISTRLIATLVISDRVAPIVHTGFSKTARGPPLV